MIDSAWQKARPYVDRLGFRLAVVLAVGLLPLMIVSIVRSQSVVDEALERSKVALVGETLQAVRPEIVLIEKSQAVAQALSQVIVPLLTDLEACDQMLDKMAEEASFSFIGFANVAGFVPCSSADEAFRLNLNMNFLEQFNDPGPTINISIGGIAGDQANEESSAVYASHPVFTNAGVLLGFVRVAFDHSKLRTSDDDASAATFFTLKADSTVLTSSSTSDDAGALLPRMFPGETVGALPVSFEREALDGSVRQYSVVPVLSGELYALATWPENTQINQFYLANPAFFPLLMWLASLGVAWFATSLFVTKDIKTLSRSMRNFADTRELTPPAAFAGAPGELRALAESFHGMTDTIVKDEAELEDAVRQKDVLLREVHHRVKNNLQLISSIMAMQMHQTKSPEVEQLMRNLQDRVNSIATVHHNLYQTSGQADVEMTELLESIVRQVVRVGASKDDLLQVETDIESLHLNPDQAVPLSLFLTEALTNAMKYMGSATDKPYIAVRLRTVGAKKARLEVENTLSESSEDELTQLSSSGLGSELMQAFAAQLDGEVKIESKATKYFVTVDFPIEDLIAKEF